MLDETDSGLDIDALKVVAAGINTLRSPERAIAAGHALPAPAGSCAAGPRARAGAAAASLRSGGPELARELEQRGYDWLLEEAA